MRKQMIAVLFVSAMLLTCAGAVCASDAKTNQPSYIRHVKYAYRNDDLGNDEWVSWLNSMGFMSHKFYAGNSSTEDFSSYDLIILGYDTGLCWGDSGNVFGIKHTNLPVVAIGQGGLTYLVAAGAASGLYSYWDSAMDKIHVEAPSSAVFSLPNVITIPGDKNITVVASSPGGKTASIVDFPGNVTVYASDPTQMDYASITLEAAKYTHWGFDTGTPTKLTDTGKKLLQNVLWNALGGYPVPEYGSAALVPVGMLGIFAAALIVRRKNE